MQGANDPWAAARRRLPGYALLRVIDVVEKVQLFQIVRADRADASCSEYLLDGATLIVPFAERTNEERARIIQEFDDLWRARRANEPA